MNVVLRILLTLNILGFTFIQSLSTCEKVGLFSLIIKGVPKDDLLRRLREKRVKVTFFVDEPLQNNDKLILSKVIEQGHELSMSSRAKVGAMDVNMMKYDVRSALNIELKHTMQRIMDENPQLIRSLSNNEHLLTNNGVSYNSIRDSKNMSITSKLTKILQSLNPSKDSSIFSISLTPAFTTETISSFIDTIRLVGFRLVPLTKCVNLKQFKENQLGAKSQALNPKSLVGKLDDNINVSYLKLNGKYAYNKKTDTLIMQIKDNPKLNKVALSVRNFDRMLIRHGGNSINKFKLDDIGQDARFMPIYGIDLKQINGPKVSDIDTRPLKRRNTITEMIQNSNNDIDNIDIKDNLQALNLKDESSSKGLKSLEYRNKIVELSDSADNDMSYRNIAPFFFVPVYKGSKKQHNSPRVDIERRLTMLYQKRDILVDSDFMVEAVESDIKSGNQVDSKASISNVFSNTGINQDLRLHGGINTNDAVSNL